MNDRCRITWWLGVVLVCCGGLAGCSHSDHSGHSDHADHEKDHADHDHGAKHAAPATLAEGVQAIVRLSHTIRHAFEEKDLKEADEALHEVGHVLKSLSGLALKEKLSAEQGTALKLAADGLSDLFGKLDQQFHGGAVIDYATVAPGIDAAVEALCQVAGVDPKGK